MKRRAFIQTSTAQTALALGLAAGIIPAGYAQTPAPMGAWNKNAFDSKTLNDAAKALGAAGAPTESKDVQVNAPEIAENGNVVRIGAQSSMPGTTMLALLIEKNPAALAAAFEVPAGTDAVVAANVKMGQTSNVYALAKVGDKYFYAVKEVKVTLGGCGG